MSTLSADAVAGIVAGLKDVRGTVTFGAPLAPLSWFRAGGPAAALFEPADEADLAAFLRQLPPEVETLVIGLGSNLLVRDGGYDGVVIRLGRAFAAVEALDGARIRAGAAAPDVKVASAAARAGIDGFSFLRGIPGSIGGALRMNGGAYGGETADVLVEARGVDRAGQVRVFSRAGMGFSYRRCAVPEDVIFTGALFQGRPGDPQQIAADMARITGARSASQPVSARTGGSTFKNPPGRRAWELVDAAGCRGLRRGAAQVSEMHCNFLINHGGATAADIEGLGEEVRRRVLEATGVELEWEIRRVGRPAATP